MIAFPELKATVSTRGDEDENFKGSILYAGVQEPGWFGGMESGVQYGLSCRINGSSVVNPYIVENSEGK